jgi:hypothetical protein
MNIVKATQRFERWLGQHTALVKPDLRLKHNLMAEAAFPFLRATFYRWLQVWPEACSQLADAPRLLAVGDLHVENFGTWRDSEGRLVWGINDFDEAAIMPYTIDLVRLATSAALAIDDGHLSVKIKDACAAILDGYRESFIEHGRPFVLEEENGWLRQMATGELRNPVAFWKKLEGMPRPFGRVPSSAKVALEHVLPDPKMKYRLVRRIAGLGSLGRVRLVAIALCHGARIAREAKAMVPSALYWTTDDHAPAEIFYSAIVSQGVRCPDPFLQLRGSWIVRRLSPYCSRIELSMLPRNREELRLLFSMGWETANIHLGTPAALKPVRRHLEKLTANRLSEAAKEMKKAVLRDWDDWKESRKA